MAMAGQHREVIDLTADDDDDAASRTFATALRPSRTVTNNTSTTTTNSHARPQNDDLPTEPPTKRVKITRAPQAEFTAWSILHRYAQAGAREAVQVHHGLEEAPATEELLKALSYTFKARIIQQNGSLSAALDAEIRADRTKLVRDPDYLPEFTGLSHQRRLAALPRTAPSRTPRPVPPPVPRAVLSNPNQFISPASARGFGQDFTGLPATRSPGQQPPPHARNDGPFTFQPSPIANGVHTNQSQAPPQRPQEDRPNGDVDIRYGTWEPAARPESQATRTSQTPTAVPMPLTGPTENRADMPRSMAQTLTRFSAAPSATLTPVPVPRLGSTGSRATTAPRDAALPAVPAVPAVSAIPAPPDAPISTPRTFQSRREPQNTPSSARRASRSAPTSPANFSSRAKKAAWASDVVNTRLDITTSANSYFALAHRPYIAVKAKQAILRSSGRLGRLHSSFLQKPAVFHVDFTSEEVRGTAAAILLIFEKFVKKSQEPYRELARLLKRLKSPADLSRLAARISLHLPGRGPEDIHAFLRDVHSSIDEILTKRSVPQGLRTQQVMSLEKDSYDKRGEDLRDSRLSSLLLAREISGNRLGSSRSLLNFTNEYRKILEDSLELRSEFTNCAGDLSTISWVSDHAYIAGTTVHMDSHNQQYNKPGNLVLGSVSRGSATLKAYAEHRIPRPIVTRGENSRGEMRESQSPWLYTSVVSSDYDVIHDRVYTSSFDRTVKVWKADKAGDSMQCLCTWEHRGLVNFVQASSLDLQYGGLVATAADVLTDAVRVFQVPKDDNEIAQSPYVSFSCSRILDPDGTPTIIDKWAYFPSTMRWGVEQSVKHLLLVGYSPRSLTGDDNDIPAERLNTGELCLWDAISGSRVTITSAKTQNVFEVLWHPTQPVFVAATSPAGDALKFAGVRTQVRIFKRVDNNAYATGPSFSEVKALDCPAVDINELTIMPNSAQCCYVTAGCTDGKTYVWDTALGDKPIQVLAHGPPVAGVAAGDGEDDTGVKFTAWGTSLDRFYTGSSDGVVKVWNVRCSGRKAKGKVVLEAPAQISFGAFSPDESKLVVGDASGRLFVLSIDQDDGSPPKFVELPGGTKKRIPTTVTPHADPPPPLGADAVDGQTLGHRYIEAGQLRFSGNPTIGMVQGLNYVQTGLYNRASYLDGDISNPLLAHVEALLQRSFKMYSNGPSRTHALWAFGKPSDPKIKNKAMRKMHEVNCGLDLDFKQLSLEIRDVLESDGIGEKELYEGLDYPGIEENEDGELSKATTRVNTWVSATKEWEDGDNRSPWV